MALPASLLSALHHAETEALGAIAPLSPADSVPSMRAFADARLLSLTPQALTTVEELLTASDLKVRKDAALAILDRSPATKPTATFGPSGISLPPAAVAALFQGLGTLLSNLGPQVQNQPTTVVEATPIEE